MAERFLFWKLASGAGLVCSHRYFSVKLPPGGTSAEKRSRPLDRLSAFFPPGGTLAEPQLHSERGVQSTLRLPNGDVALCPKDARSSFITFLRSGDHDDDAVKATAIAMRHSSKTQASAAYDKGACDRRESATMKVAAGYSAKFTAGATDNQ